jgi:hypothetical protein
MRLFVLSPEIEDRDRTTGRSTKRLSTLNYTSKYILFYLQADHKKKIGHELIYFLLLQLQFSNLQFLNFKAPVIRVLLL